MATYGQNKLNKDDVRRGTLNFIFSFILLCGLSFLSVYLFFKTAQMQNREIRKELDEFNGMLGRNQLLKAKADTIYYKMSLLSNDKVENDIFLRNSVIEDIGVARQLIGRDSADNLRHYSILLKNIGPALAFKNEMIKLKTEEGAAKRNLQDCVGSTARISSQKLPGTRQEPKGRLFKNAK